MSWQFGRAPSGGAPGVNGRWYKGGRLLPFYVPREAMPQVDEAYFPDLREFAEQCGWPLSDCVLQPEALRPHQRIDAIKAGRMTNAVLAKPILISEDLFILDGNHRWKAHVERNVAINCWKIPAPFEAAIDCLFAFPRTYTLATHVEGD